MAAMTRQDEARRGKTRRPSARSNLVGSRVAAISLGTFRSAFTSSRCGAHQQMSRNLSEGPVSTGATTVLHAAQTQRLGRCGVQGAKHAMLRQEPVAPAQASILKHLHLLDPAELQATHKGFHGLVRPVQLQTTDLPCPSPFRCAALLFLLSKIVFPRPHVQLHHLKGSLEAWVEPARPSPPSSVNHKLGVVCF
jgi:hypothetical protein